MARGDSAQIARLELEERIGKLFRRDKVRMTAVHSAKKALNELVALAQRVSAILAATQDPAEGGGCAHAFARSSRREGEPVSCMR